jgi:hypothetical protein
MPLRSAAARTRRVVAAALLAVALLAACAAADESSAEAERRSARDDSFRRCFCWNNATNDFCGGEEWHRSAECERFQWTMWWLPPFVMLAIAYVLYPFALCVGRFFCDCCGGSLPSRGFCCPTDADVKHFPGYADSTVWATKAGYSLSALLYTCVGITAIIFIAIWSATARDFLETIVDTSGTMLHDLQRTENNLRNLTAAPAFTNASVVSGVAAAYATFADQYGRISKVGDSVESDVRTQPKNISFAAVILPFIFLLIGFVLMVFGVTGLPVTILAGLFSWSTALIVVAAMLFLVIAVALGTVCRNFDETLTPIVVGMIQGVGGCHNPVLMTAINATATEFDAYVRNASLPLCTDIAALCAIGFTCGASPCGRPNATFVAGTPYRLPDVAQLSAFTRTTRLPGLGLSLSECAAGCGAHAAAQAAAGRVLAFARGHAASIETLVLDLYPQTYRCHFVRTTLKLFVFPKLCAPATGVTDRSDELAALLGSLVIVATLAQVMFVRGVKRFAPQTSPFAARDCDCPCHDAHAVGRCRCRCPPAPGVQMAVIRHRRGNDQGEFVGVVIGDVVAAAAGAEAEHYAGAEEDEHDDAPAEGPAEPEEAPEAQLRLERQPDNEDLAGVDDISIDVGEPRASRGAGASDLVEDDATML